MQKKMIVNSFFFTFILVNILIVRSIHFCIASIYNDVNSEVTPGVEIYDSVSISLKFGASSTWFKVMINQPPPWSRFRVTPIKLKNIIAVHRKFLLL